MTFNIFEDTCSTCKVWQSVSRQSQFGGCPLETEGVQGPFIMDRNDACGRWESMKPKGDIMPDETDGGAGTMTKKQREEAISIITNSSMEESKQLADPNEVLEEIITQIKEAMVEEPAIDADWSEWESFYGNLLEKSSDD